MTDLTQYDDAGLVTLTEEIRTEQQKRLLARFKLDPKIPLITLRSGFSGGPGRKVYYVGQGKKGEPSESGATWSEDYYCFSDQPGGRSCWLVRMDENLLDVFRVAG